MLVAVIALAGATWMLKGAGSLLPAPPPGMARRLEGLAPALLAGLVAVSLTGRGGIPKVDARLVAVAVATGLAALRAPFLVCVVAAAAAAGLLRLAGVP